MRCSGIRRQLRASRTCSPKDIMRHRQLSGIYVVLCIDQKPNESSKILPGVSRHILNSSGCGPSITNGSINAERSADLPLRIGQLLEGGPSIGSRSPPGFAPGPQLAPGAKGKKIRRMQQSKCCPKTLGFYGGSVCESNAPLPGQTRQSPVLKTGRITGPHALPRPASRLESRGHPIVNEVRRYSPIRSSSTWITVFRPKHGHGLAPIFADFVYLRFQAVRIRAIGGFLTGSWLPPLTIATGSSQLQLFRLSGKCSYGCHIQSSCKPCRNLEGDQPALAR